jgi:hypothetical protein
MKKVIQYAGGNHHHAVKRGGDSPARAFQGGGLFAGYPRAEERGFCCDSLRETYL